MALSIKNTKRQLLFGFLFVMVFVLVACVPVSTYSNDWNAAFDRSGIRDTWLSADGIYSVSLDGNDAIGSANAKTQTFFIFSDTFIGSARKDGSIFDADMVNHSAMLLSGNVPNGNNFNFIWGERGDKKSRTNIFKKNQWMFDMLCDGKKLYLFGFSYTDTWKPTSIDMYEVPIIDGMPNIANYKTYENITELMHTTASAQYVFSMAITPNTETAGAPSPDGYYYFYGYRDNLSAFIQTKDLLVARIHEHDFPDFSKLRYYNGVDWCENITESQAIIENVSCEMSVTPIIEGVHAGKYVAVYTEMVSSGSMKYAIGQSPYGPFDESVEFYCSEHGSEAVGKNGTLYTYNAKAHPHLSQGNHLLISYNVNVNGSVAVNTKDYIPRFLYLDLDQEVPCVVA